MRTEEVLDREFRRAVDLSTLPPQELSAEQRHELDALIAGQVRQALRNDAASQE